MVRSRDGTRAGSSLLVVHVALTDPRRERTPRVGFVVSKAVGPAVVRNRTKRRLRALVSTRLGSLPAGVDLVVRAQSSAGAASSTQLGAELDRLLPQALTRLARSVAS